MYRDGIEPFITNKSITLKKLLFYSLFLNSNKHTKLTIKTYMTKTVTHIIR